MRKSTRIWNRYICPTIEVLCYGVAAVFVAASLYVMTVLLVLVAN